MTAQAIGDFTECISLFPLDAKCYFERGNAYVSIGQDEKALHDLTMYTLLVTDYSQIPESLNNTCSKLQQAIGIHLASIEIERRKKDPSYVIIKINRIKIRLLLSLLIVILILSLVILRVKRKMNITLNNILLLN